MCNVLGVTAVLELNERLTLLNLIYSSSVKTVTFFLLEIHLVSPLIHNELLKMPQSKPSQSAQWG